MEWPSERVAHGGLFHPHKVTYSKDTHDLIKLLMDEQKLTMFQRNKLNYHLRNGEPLPPPQISNEEKFNGGKANNKLAYLMLRAKTANKRSLNAIKASGAYDYEKYVPPNYVEPSEKQKIRLQQRMSGLTVMPELDTVNVERKHKHRKNKLEEEEHDLVTELMNEICERVDWLNEMEALGEGKKHRSVIKYQIDERLRMLKKIEKEREKELAQNNNNNYNNNNNNNE